MVRKRENKNYRSFPFLTDTQWKIPKKQQKKLKKITMAAFHCGFILSQNMLEKAGKERK